MLFLGDSDPRFLVWQRCESPIEQQMCCGLFALLGCNAVLGPYDFTRRGELAQIAHKKPAAFLFAQHDIDRYRVDFLVVLIDPALRRSQHFAVECDGAEYHDAAADAVRDAAIVRHGYKFVLRFTGRQIHRQFGHVMRGIAAVLEAFGITPEEPADLCGYGGLLKRVNHAIEDTYTRRQFYIDLRKQERRQQEYEQQCLEEHGFLLGEDQFL